MNSVTRQSVLTTRKVFHRSFFPILSNSKTYVTQVNDEAGPIKVKKTDIVPKNVLSIHERGIFQDIFPPASVTLPEKFKEKQCFYCGFDPTADSLHVGNLLSLMALLHCQKAGNLVKI